MPATPVGKINWEFPIMLAVFDCFCSHFFGRNAKQKGLNVIAYSMIAAGSALYLLKE
jgi:hypothetical protein